MVLITFKKKSIKCLLITNKYKQKVINIGIYVRLHWLHILSGRFHEFFQKKKHIVLNLFISTYKFLDCPNIFL